MDTTLRFTVVQIKDGPWVVVEQHDHRRRIASCADADAARMIAAFMNGDFEEAILGRDAATARLRRST
jgi:hypothetical protein